ncbi:hypothetical protein, partial [Pseudomonas sp. PA-6-1D]|uniref:hypothetical protein n=2 Tax=Pseudomonas TaxID=286 RepID=UPI001F2D5E4F
MISSPLNINVKEIVMSIDHMVYAYTLSEDKDNILDKEQSLEVLDSFKPTDEEQFKLLKELLKGKTDEEIRQFLAQANS